MQQNLAGFLQKSFIAALLLIGGFNVSAALAAESAINFVAGWNLVGNSVSAPLTVSTTFSNATNVSTVWAWKQTGTNTNIAYPTWAFYTPTQTDGGAAYAASKGYDFLTTINAGEGFWVNAKAAFAASLPPGTSYSLAATNLANGWNLAATGDNITPATLTANVGNVATLWAWDSTNKNWYFYAPSLAANNTLASYIQTKGYTDFGVLSLGNGLGFWVNYNNTAPTGVKATLGDVPNTVTVNFTGPASIGGSPITGYTVISTPSGIAASGTASPITVTCPSTCTGYAFSVIATNAVGDGVPSAQVDVITNYNVVERFYEPDTQPRDSIFIGSFTFNATTSTVSNLHGILSESMTGTQIAYPNDNMTWLNLTHQLSSAPITLDGMSGLLVTTFKNPNTNTLSTMGGGNGWAPGSGFGLYYGFPEANAGNAYAMIFVNTADPTAALTATQINKLAYADCAPGGMMGGTCMTGTTVAGYGTVGTMSGYPVSQVITKQ